MNSATVTFHGGMGFGFAKNNPQQKIPNVSFIDTFGNLYIPALSCPDNVTSGPVALLFSAGP